jgi:hypothetical protein
MLSIYTPKQHQRQFATLLKGFGRCFDIGL